MSGDEGWPVLRGTAVLTHKYVSSLAKLWRKKKKKKKNWFPSSSRLPIEERLVARHPNPLSVKTIVDTLIRIKGASGVVRVEAANGKCVVPVGVVELIAV
jgi:hypothetical protein